MGLCGRLWAFVEGALGLASHGGRGLRRLLGGRLTLPTLRYGEQFCDAIVELRELLTQLRVRHALLRQMRQDAGQLSP